MYEANGIDQMIDKALEMKDFKWAQELVSKKYWKSLSKENIEMFVILDSIDIWSSSIRVKFHAEEKNMDKICKLLSFIGTKINITLCCDNSFKELKVTFCNLEMETGSQDMLCEIYEDFDEIEGLFKFLKKPCKLKI